MDSVRKIPSKVFLLRTKILDNQTQAPKNIIALSNKTCVLLFQNKCLIVSLQNQQISTLNFEQHKIKGISKQARLIPGKNDGFLLLDDYKYYFVDSQLKINLKSASGYFTHMRTWGVHQTGDIFMNFFDSTVQKQYTGDAYKFGSSCVYGNPGKLSSDEAYQIKYLNQKFKLSSLHQYPGTVAAEEHIDTVYDKEKIHIIVEKVRKNGRGNTSFCNIWPFMDHNTVLTGSLDSINNKFYLILINIGTQEQTVLKEFDNILQGEIKFVNESKKLIILSLKDSDKNRRTILYDYHNHEEISTGQVIFQKQKLSSDFKYCVQTCNLVKQSKEEQSSKALELSYWEMIQTKKLYMHLLERSGLISKYGKGLPERLFNLLEI